MTFPPATILQLFDAGLKKYEPGSTLFSTKRSGRWHPISVEAFTTQVREVAMGLYALGVRPGDRVSIHSENSTEWMVVDQAVQSIGAANVPIYTTQPGDQIRFILGNSGAKVHFVSGDELFADTKSIIREVSGVKAIVTFSASKHEKLKHYETLLKEGRKQIAKTPKLFDKLKKKVKPDDLATLIYTSGTTGVPKGVMLTQNNIASNIRGSLERIPFTMEEAKGQNILSYLPLSHVFERLMTYLYVSMGGRVHYIEEVDDIKDDFKHIQPFFFATVPRLLEKIQTGVKVRGQDFDGLRKRLYYWAIYLAERYDPEHPPTGLAAAKRMVADKVVYSKIRELFGGNLCGMISGGAALSPDLFRFVNALGLYCGQGYGLTETSPVIAVQDRKHLRIGSSGLPLTDVEVKIAEDDEILVKGPNVMKGYFMDKELTREVMTSDGWLMTGDVGKIDEDGYLYITDRKKDLFKLSTGKYVAPQNIENRLVGSGFVEQAVILGEQRKFCAALIAPNIANIHKRLKREGYTPEEPIHTDPKVRELVQTEVDRANRDLTPWETVKRFELLEQPLSIEGGELTPTLKVKRPVVNEKYAEQISRLYEDEE
ncbi:MAG: long-chain fatty acid--CoA ligase [Balneolaceae bacterium]